MQHLPPWVLTQPALGRTAAVKPCIRPCKVGRLSSRFSCSLFLLPPLSPQIGVKLERRRLAAKKGGKGAGAAASGKAKPS